MLYLSVASSSAAKLHLALSFLSQGYPAVAIGLDATELKALASRLWVWGLGRFRLGDQGLGLRGFGI